MQISFARHARPKSGALAVFCGAGLALSETASEINSAMNGALVAAAKQSRFTGARAQILEILAPAGIASDRVLLIGTGDTAAMKRLDWESLGATIYAKVAMSGAKALTVAIDGARSGEASAALANGLLLRSWRFDKYRSRETADKKPTLTRAVIMTSAVTAARNLFADMEAVAAGVFLTRELVSEPANIINPVTFADKIKDLEQLGVTVTILNERDMKRLGMGALLGVGQGSATPPRLAVMEWDGRVRKKKADAPLALIGKGVTFDTGGISLKPGAGMEAMKWDMGGAGCVVGAMHALAARKAKVHVVGAVGLVENMPSGTAQRPGDVVTSMSGQTIEVINTDAEGRLVLADVLWYVKETYKPKAMIDFATLTGAMIVALGHEYAGFMSTSDSISAALTKAGEAVGDKVWRFPLHDTYDKDINCAIADMKNLGSAGKAGSITAAQFLKRFVGDVPWAHLDIAGTVWWDKDGPLWEKGATGYGVRLVDQLVRDAYEQ